MAHSYYACYEHAVFSTKHRRAFLTPENQNRIFAYLSKALDQSGCRSLMVGGHREHVHMLYRKSNDIHTKDLLGDIKRQSSIWIKGAKLTGNDFYWQTGYGAFSISYWDLEKVRQYIEPQEEHHKKWNWEEEYRKLLMKHGVEFDERFFID